MSNNLNGNDDAGGVTDDGLGIGSSMISMTRDALCVNVNSLVSALAQRSKHAAAPLILNVILLFDRVIVTSANHGWNA